MFALSPMTSWIASLTRFRHSCPSSEEMKQHISVEASRNLASQLQGMGQLPEKVQEALTRYLEALHELEPPLQNKLCQIRELQEAQDCRELTTYLTALRELISALELYRQPRSDMGVVGTVICGLGDAVAGVDTEPKNALGAPRGLLGQLTPWSGATHQPGRVAAELRKELEGFLLRAGEPTIDEWLNREVDEKVRCIITEFRAGDLMQLPPLSQRLRDSAIQKREVEIFEERKSELLRSFAALGLLGFVAMLPPTREHPRKLLAITLGTTILAASNKEAEMVLDSAVDYGVAGIQRLVRHRCADKLAIGFLLMYWYADSWLDAVPALGRLTTVASGGGIAVAAGVHLWRFQREGHSVRSTKEPGEGIATKLMNELKTSELMEELELSEEVKEGISAVYHGSGRVVSLLKLPLLAGFVMLYPMTTNSHVTCLAIGVATALASSSTLYNHLIDSDLGRLLYWSVCAVGGLMAFTALISLPSLLKGYHFGRYTEGPLPIQLHRIGECAQFVAAFNRKTAIWSGTWLGSEISRLQGNLVRRRGETHSPHKGLEPVRTWLKRANLATQERIHD